MPAGRLHAYDASRKTSRLRCQQEDYVYDASRKTSRLRCQQEDFTLTMPAERLRLRCTQEAYTYDIGRKSKPTVYAGRLRLRCLRPEDYAYVAHETTSHWSPQEDVTGRFNNNN